MKTITLIIALIAAALTGYSQTNVITPTGVSRTGGTQPGCVGTYVGYAQYTKPFPTWGWQTNKAPLTATAQRTNDVVVYNGQNADAGCGVGSVTIPSPAYSQKYRFLVYFKGNIPTNSASCPLTLKGFNP